MVLDRILRVDEENRVKAGSNDEEEGTASHRQCPITLHLHLLLLDSYMLQHCPLLPFGPPQAITITKTRQALSHLISLPPLLRPRHLAPSCYRTCRRATSTGCQWRLSGTDDELDESDDDDADKEEVPVPPPSSFPILHSYNFFCSRVWPRVERTSNLLLGHVPQQSSGPASGRPN